MRRFSTFRWLLTWFLVAGCLPLLGGVAGAQEHKVVTPAGKTYFTGRKPLPPAVVKDLHDKAQRRHGNLIARLQKVTATSYDCRTMGWVPPIRDQGQCGSCWDFSGSGVVGSALIKAGQLPNTTNQPSEQYTLDCGQNGGCGGDDNITVLQWAKATGLPLDSDYGKAYQARSGRCAYTSSMKLYKLTDWGFCTPNQQSGVASTDDIKKCLANFGPIGVGIDAGVLGDGTGPITGSGHSIDHDVIVIGWVDNSDAAKFGLPQSPTGGWWIMRNSWGTGWGQKCGGIEGGYCYIAYGSGDIGTEACWAQAAAVGPPPSPWIFRIGFGLPNPSDPYTSSKPCCGAGEEPKRSGPDYTATLTTNRPFGPGEFGNSIVGITAKIDEQLPPGEYRTKLTRTSGKGFTHCPCSDYSDCTCPNGGSGGASCLCNNCHKQSYDTKTIWRDPESGQRWRYTDQKGNFEVVPNIVIPQYQPMSFAPQMMAGCST